MEWAWVLIVLIPLLVWVLATIFRGATEANTPARRPTADGGAPLRPPANELDRFLQEAHQRREKVARRKAERAREEALEMSELAPPPPPPPPAPPPVPKSPEPRPRKDVTPPRRERPAAEKRPEPLVAPTPAPGAPAPVARPAPAPAGRRPAAPVLPRLAALLRDRQALAAGLVLREILDRPLCQRRRR